MRRLFLLGILTLFLCSCQLPSDVETPKLHVPEDDAVVATTCPQFDWGGVGDVSSYQLQVDDKSSFETPMIDITVGPSEYELASPLDDGIYWWRVRTFLCIGGT